MLLTITVHIARSCLPSTTSFKSSVLLLHLFTCLHFSCPLPTTNPMIGFQCSTTITQPCLGRTIFPSSGPHPNAPNVAFHNRAQISPNLIDYFPLNGDGLRLNWAHAVNSRSKLMVAIAGKFCSFIRRSVCIMILPVF